MRRQRHGQQEHGPKLARHAGDLRVLRLVGLDQPGELQNPCKERGWDFSYSSVIASHLIWLSKFMLITIEGASAIAPVFTYT